MATIRSFNTGPDERDAQRAALAQEQQGFFGDLAQGARSGGLRAMGAINTLAGHRAEQLGLGGSQSLARAQDYLQRSEKAAEGLTSWEDADFGRKGARWLAGALGQSAPYFVPAVAAGALSRNPLTAMAFTTAATAPAEIGEQLIRQEQDPANAGKTSAERMEVAAPTGIAAAGLQAIPFIGTGSKIAGRSLTNAPIARSGILSTIGKEAVTGGVTEAGAEGIRQTGDQALNPNAEYNAGAMWDAGLQGGVMSGAVGAAGAPAHAFHKLTAAPGDLIRSGGIELNNMGEKLKGFVGSAKAKAEGVDLTDDGKAPRTDGGIDLGGDKPPADATTSAAEGVMSGLKGMREGASRMLDRVASGEEFFRPETFAGKTEGALRAAVAEDGILRQNAVTQWAKELPEKYLTPEVRAAMSDMANAANQKTIAAARRALQAAEDTKAKISELRKRFKKARNDATVVDVNGTWVDDEPPALGVNRPLLGNATKPSLDYREADRSIVSAVTPYLQQNLPHLMEPEGLQQMAPPLRSAVATMLKGEQLTSDQVFGLINVLGEHTVSVLDRVRQGMKATDEYEAAEFYSAAERLQAIQDAHLGLANAIRENAPGGPDSVHPAELSKVVDGLTKWAMNVKGDGAAQRVRDAEMRRTLQNEFGTKGAEAILTALDNMVPRKENMISGAPDAEGLAELKGDINTKRVKDGDKDADRETTTLYDTVAPVEKPKQRVLDRKLVMNEEASPGKSGFESAQAQSRKRAESLAGDREVRWVTAEELGDDHPKVAEARAEIAKRMVKEQPLGDNPTRAQIEEYVKGEMSKLGAHVYDMPPGAFEFTDADVAAMRFDEYETTGRRRDTESTRIQVGGEGGPVFDALKIASRANALLRNSREPWNPRDERGGRDGRAFAEGIAALQVYFDEKIEVPDDVVINAKKNLTWGKAKRAGDAPANPAGVADYDPRIESRIANLEVQFDAVANGFAQKAFDKVKARGDKLSKAEFRALAKEIHAWAREQALETPEGAKLNSQIFELRKKHTEDTASSSMRDMEFNPTEQGFNMNRLTHAQGATKDADGNEVAARPATFLGTTDYSARTKRLRDIAAEMSGLDLTKTADRVRSQALWREQEILLGLQDSPLGTGVQEGDPFGSTFQGGKTLDSVTPGGINVDSAGDSFGRVEDTRVARPGAPSLVGPGSKLAEGGRAGSRGISKENAESLPYVDPKTGKVEGTPFTLNQILAEVANNREKFEIDDMHSLSGKFDGYTLRQVRPKLWELIDPKNKPLHRFREGADGEIYGATNTQQAKRVTEGSPDPKAVAAKKAAFLEKARSGDKALIETLKASNDAKGLQRAAQALYDEPDARDTIDAINSRLSELTADPDTAYGMLTRKYSLDATQMAPNAAGPRQSTFKEAGEYIKKVLGPKVEVEIAKIAHAGDFTPGWARGKAEDLIRLSVHHLNPMSAAFHESMHGLVEHLTKNKLGEVTNVLLKAASSPTVTLRLRELLKDSPEALAQLKDPEERLAYMYQFHALGKDLGLGAPAKGVFNKIAEYIRSVLGIWSNDQRALHIMEYFQQGNLPKAKNAGDIRAALMEPGTNRGLEWAKKASEPLRNLGEAVAVAGHQRLRDTEIPALIQLADLIKLKGTNEGDDPGFIPVSREERGVRMNAYVGKLGDINKDGLSAALEVLQGADRTATLGALDAETKIAAVTAIHATRTLLQDMKGYLNAAGVQMGDLGEKYFPRVYDLNYISSHKDEFLTTLKNHNVPNAEGILQKLMTSQGTEFDIEVNRPGMQAAKKRVLDMVPDDALRPFMEKDLLRIIDSYVTQATRRAEWTRRFDSVNEKGEPVANGKLNDLLAQAKREGATEKDLDAANKYIKAVDGTLGDTISPEFRRLQGNIMVYQNLRTLPLMIFSSIVDPGGIMVRGGSVGDAFRALKRGLSEIPKNFQADPKHDAATRFAEEIGTIESSVLASVLGEAYTQGMVGDTGRKINDALFKYNLANQFNVSMRVAATEAAVKFLARHADGKGTHSLRYLAELGLEPKDFVFGTNLTGERGALKLTEADGLTPEQALKFRHAINRWVDGAVLRPDAADKPVWMSDPHYALIAHLKQFTFAFQEVILKRAVHEMRHGNYMPVYALASYIPMMVAADSLKAVLTGAQGPGEELDDLLGHGMERAGLLGVGQYPVDMLQDLGRGGSGLSPLMGPTIEQFTQAVQVMGGRRAFDSFVVDSMPANALYENHLGAGPAEVAPAR